MLVKWVDWPAINMPVKPTNCAPVNQADLPATSPQVKQTTCLLVKQVDQPASDAPGDPVNLPTTQLSYAQENFHHPLAEAGRTVLKMTPYSTALRVTSG